MEPFPGTLAEVFLAFLHAAIASKETGIARRFWWNGGSTGGPISQAWQVQGWPTIYVIDARGVIRYKNVRGDGMDQAVDTLLKGLETRG